MLSQLRRVVFVDGCRIPFKMSNTDYKDLISVDLGRAAIAGLVNRLPALNTADLSGVIYGTVIQEGKKRPQKWVGNTLARVVVAFATACLAIVHCFLAIVCDDPNG